MALVRGRDLYHVDLVLFFMIVRLKMGKVARVLHTITNMNADGAVGSIQEKRRLRV